MTSSEQDAQLHRASDFFSAVSGTPRRVFLTCFLGMTLCTADQAFFSYSIPALMKEFDVDLSVIGLVLSASFALATVTVVAAGVLADRYGRARMFVILLGLSAVFVALHAAANDIVTLGVLRAASFALAAGIYPIGNTLVIETAPARYRGVLAGTLQVAYPLGFFLGSLIAAQVLDTAGWRVAFLTAAVVVPVAALLGRFLPEPTTFAKREQPKVSRQGGLLSELTSRAWRKTVICCFVGSAMSSLAVGGLTYFLPVFLVEEYQATPSLAASLVGLTYLIGIVGYVLAFSVGEFLLTRRNTLITWLWIGGAILGATVWLANSVAAVVAGVAMTIMFLFGSEAVRMAMIAELFPARLRVTGGALAGAAGVTTGLLIVPMLLGELAPRLGWPVSFTLTAVLPLIVAGAAFLMVDNKPSAQPLDESAA